MEIKKPDKKQLKETYPDVKWLVRTFKEEVFGTSVYLEQQRVRCFQEEVQIETYRQHRRIESGDTVEDPDYPNLKYVLEADEVYMTENRKFHAIIKL